MATVTTYGIEWAVNRGTPMDTPSSIDTILDGNSGQFSEYQWEDATARLVEGPEQLTGFIVQGRVWEDTAEIDDATGDVVSVSRSYPSYTMSEMSISGGIGNDWVDPDNPAKPRQHGGPIFFSSIDMNQAVPGGGYCKTGLHEYTAKVNGFVNGIAGLPSVPPVDDQQCFLMDITTGIGYIWADSIPGQGSGPKWTNTGVAKDPALINTTAVASINDLPVGDGAPDVGTWQLVNTGTYGTMYEYNDEGWMNIGPLQAGDLPFVVIPEDEKKSYVSGYIYPLVFDQARFRYVPRLSGATQTSYGGSVDISTTGWFPTLPHNPERGIFPMDSVTHFLADDRELVSAVYTVTMNTNLASDTITIVQDVYQPTYNWGNLLRDMLNLCSFTNGYYH